MKLHGIGTDIVDVNRIKKSIKNKIFLSRLFSKEEIIKQRTSENDFLRNKEGLWVALQI